MNIRRIVLGAVLVVLVFTSGFALAQSQSPTGSYDWRSMRRSLFPDRGSAMQLEGMMQQMGGMMEHMAARIQAGPLTLEQTKQMSEVMRHIADMITSSYGMRGAETPPQILNMMERMTEMHKRLMVVTAAPQPAPQQK